MCVCGTWYVHVCVCVYLCVCIHFYLYNVHVINVIYTNKCKYNMYIFVSIINASVNMYIHAIEECMWVFGVTYLNSVCGIKYFVYITRNYMYM